MASELTGERWMRHELRSWVIGLAVGLPGSFLLVLLIGALPAAFHRPMLVAVSLVPWLTIWMIDRQPIFAVGLWLVPSLAAIGLAHVSGSHLLFHVVLLTAVLAGASCCMYERAWRAFDRVRAAIQGWIVSHTLREPDRRVQHALKRALWRDAGERHASLVDEASAARGLRRLAERIRRIDAPDEGWDVALETVVASSLAYAEMLEGSRPLDHDLVDDLVRRRKETFHALYSGRSRAYRWMTFRLFAGSGPR